MVSVGEIGGGDERVDARGQCPHPRDLLQRTGLVARGLLGQGQRLVDLLAGTRRDVRRHQRGGHCRGWERRCCGEWWWLRCEWRGKESGTTASTGGHSHVAVCLWPPNGRRSFPGRRRGDRPDLGRARFVAWRRRRRHWAGRRGAPSTVPAFGGRSRLGLRESSHGTLRFCCPFLGALNAAPPVCVADDVCVCVCLCGCRGITRFWSVAVAP